MQSVLHSLSQFATDCYDWGSDVYFLNQNRRTSEEISLIASKLADQTLPLSPGSSRIRPLRQSLPDALNRLTQAFQAANAATNKPSVSWGNPAEPEPTRDPPSAHPMPPSAEPLTSSQGGASVAPNLRPTVYLSAIELADWLQRASEDERIAPAQRLAVATKKTNILLGQLEVVRLDASGHFDGETQEIVDVVVTEDAALDQTVAGTVLPGYKLREKLIRPQKVQIYRHNGT